MANFCTNCGSKLVENSTFCTSCGHAVGDNVSNANNGNVNSNVNPNSNQNVINKFTKQINELAGGKGAVNLRLRDLFSNVFKKHTTEAATEIFTCGTKNTTPKESEISSSWPKPWLYTRVCLMFAITFLLLQICVELFDNGKALPGMMFVGAIMVPFALIIFFLEVNAPRNISFYDISKIFFVGGGASLVITLFLYSITEGSDDHYVAAILTGIIEEVGKAAIVVYCIAKMPNLKYMLNGLLIGAAVGAGFATFETVGYIFEFFFNYDYDTMKDVLYLRAILAPGGHVAWAAIYGAALMLVKKNKTFNSSMIIDKKFLSFFGITVILHSIWDMPIDLGELAQKIFLVQDVLIIIAWIIILVLIQVGLSQIGSKEFTNESSTHVSSQNIPQQTNI
ncbi:MAG: hypothetical protein A2Y15_08350 [Clostridiales bacterium GWF2_36_10]|nr:MAG: hypothetical protein A2Y15_08350 [Clostridiales bacterium GWF2_36_10]HAN20312.1 PrsW family intramembrane metalloprotease [Clostridiales bacterium]